MLAPGAKANTAAIAQIKAMPRRLALLRRACILPANYHAEAAVWQVNQQCPRFLPNPGRAGQDFRARIGVLASTPGRQLGDLYLDGLRKAGLREE